MQLSGWLSIVYILRNGFDTFFQQCSRFEQNVIASTLVLANLILAVAIIPRVLFKQLTRVAIAAPANGSEEGIGNMWDGVGEIFGLVCSTRLGNLAAVVLAAAFVILLLTGSRELISGFRKRKSSRSKDVEEGNQEFSSGAWTLTGAFAIPALIIFIPSALGLPALDCLV